MTENLLQKLEERMMMVLSEVEVLRREVQQLHQENSTLKFERDSNTHKLQGLVSLLDSMNVVDNSSMSAMNVAMAKPVLVQG